MAKEGDNTILIIGGLAVAAFFLLNKRSAPVANNAYTPYRPTNGSYGYSNQTGGTGQIIQGAGSAIADIINAIKGKNNNAANNNNDNQSSGIDLDGFSNEDYWDYINSDYWNYA